MLPFIIYTWNNTLGFSTRSACPSPRRAAGGRAEAHLSRHPASAWLLTPCSSTYLLTNRLHRSYTQSKHRKAVEASQCANRWLEFHCWLMESWCCVHKLHVSPEQPKRPTMDPWVLRLQEAPKFSSECIRDFFQSAPRSKEIWSFGGSK